MPTVAQLQDKIERLEARIAAAEAANAALREEVKSAATLRTFEQIVFGRVPPPRHLHPVGTS